MRRMRTIAGRFLGALLGAALALSPLAAIEAMAVPAESSSHHAVVPDTPPCDMPCDDCGDGKSSAACALACSGLIASIPAPAFAALPTVPAAHAEAILAILCAGREREPDKPPPRPVLA